MPRGSKPGERRGGRQRGTPNKKTVLQNAAASAAAMDPNISPREFMLRLMRDTTLPLEDRFTAAQAALPLVHPKLASGRGTASASGRNKRTFADIKALVESPPIARKMETGLTIATTTQGANLSPLDFFLAVMRDPDAPFPLRTKAARIVAPFVHPKPSSRRADLVIDDPFGFVIDPVAARELRDADWRNELIEWNIYRLDPKRIVRAPFSELQRALGESTPCPKEYTSADAAADEARMAQLRGKTIGGSGLTAEEDAEEAHLFGRVAAFMAAAGHDRPRVEALKALGEKRSEAEQSELDALEARYRFVPHGLLQEAFERFAKAGEATRRGEGALDSGAPSGAAARE
jgi:hypothetical protein